METHSELWLRSVLDEVGPLAAVTEAVEQFTDHPEFQPGHLAALEPFRREVPIGREFIMDDLTRRGIPVCKWKIQAMERSGIVRFLDKRPTGREGFGLVRRIYRRLQ